MVGFDCRSPSVEIVYRQCRVCYPFTSISVLVKRSPPESNHTHTLQSQTVILAILCSMKKKKFFFFGLYVLRRGVLGH